MNAKDEKMTARVNLIIDTVLNNDTFKELIQQYMKTQIAAAFLSGEPRGRARAVDNVVDEIMKLLNA